VNETETVAPEHTIRPIGDVVHLRMLEETGRITDAGIIIPDTVHARPHQAVVLAVGSGRWAGGARVPSPLKRGDRVVVNPHKIERVLAEGAMAQAAGTPFANFNEEFLIREEHILCVITGKEPTFIEIEVAIGTLRSAVFSLGPGDGFGVTLDMSLVAIRDAFAERFGFDRAVHARKAVDGDE
jgi:co-chaperonin GroES (HSP10)